MGIIGIHKALLEMQSMGWIGRKMPKLTAVQAAGCAPIVRAFEQGKEASEPWREAQTVAQGIRVPKALGDFLVLRAVRETEGTCVAVSDEEVLAGLAEIGRMEGIFICPEGATLIGAAKRLLRDGFLKTDERVVLLNTGAGIKYPDIVKPSLPLVELNATL